MAAIDREHLACDPRGLLRDEEEDAGRDGLGGGALPVLAVARPLPDRGRVREDEPGRDAVDRDPVRAELPRRLAREADLAGLRARVGLDAGQADAPAGARGDVDDAP